MSNASLMKIFGFAWYVVKSAVDDIKRQMLSNITKQLVTSLLWISLLKEYGIIRLTASLTGSCLSTKESQLLNFQIIQGKNQTNDTKKLSKAHFGNTVLLFQKSLKDKECFMGKKRPKKKSTSKRSLLQLKKLF